MDLSPTLPTVIYAIWWTVLLVVVVVIVPLAIALLHRTLRAARAVDRYLAEMLEAGVGIAGNTGSIPALGDTLSVAGAMIATAGSIKSHTATMASVLSQRATRGRPS